MPLREKDELKDKLPPESFASYGITKLLTDIVFERDVEPEDLANHAPLELTEILEEKNKSVFESYFRGKYKIGFTISNSRFEEIQESFNKSKDFLEKEQLSKSSEELLEEKENEIKEWNRKYNEELDARNTATTNFDRLTQETSKQAELIEKYENRIKSIEKENDLNKKKIEIYHQHANKTAKEAIEKLEKE